MKIHLLIDDRAEDLELLTSNGDTCLFRLGTESPPRQASVVAVEPSVYSVLLDGTSYDVRIAGSVVEVGDRRFHIDVIDPRDWRQSASAAAAGGRQQVIASMPGKVVRVLVAEGDEMEAGQGLVVVEAMKMQNEMQAPKSGRVTSVTVAAGDTVAAGQVLVVIE